jgi:hypothetical protein
MKVRWEYQVVDGFQGKGVAAFLNEQGEQEWELVLVNSKSYYLKRPIASDASKAA